MFNILGKESMSSEPPVTSGTITGPTGRGGRGGRWSSSSNGDCSNNRNRNNNNIRRQTPRFVGREPLLQGNIFDSGEGNVDQFIKTTHEITIYIGTRHKKYVSTFAEAVRTLELVDPAAPTDPDPTDILAVEKWKLAITKYVTMVDAYSDFRANLYSVVMGQCSDSLMERLRSHSDFPQANQDGLLLLKIIKSLIYTSDDKRKPIDVITDMKARFYTMQQGKSMSLQRYYEMFSNQVEVLKEMGVGISDPAIIGIIAEGHGRANAPIEADIEEAKNQALAMQFIRGANAKYKGYLTHLRNSYLDSMDYYPSTVHQAYNILKRRESDQMTSPKENNRMALATTAANDQINNAMSRSTTTPLNGSPYTQGTCTDSSHRQHNVDKTYVQSVTLTQQGVTAFETSHNSGQSTSTFSFSQSDGPNIPTSWILLDSQSTVDLFCNSDLLRDIRSGPSNMRIYCNAGTRTTNMIGDLPGYGTVWYDKNAISNILSLKRVRLKYRVLYDSDQENKGFTVIKPDGEEFQFKESSGGLHYLDTNEQPSGTALVTTVFSNQMRYTPQAIERAKKARDLQIKIAQVQGISFG